MNVSLKHAFFPVVAAAVLAVTLLPVNHARATTVTEPHTVFYGKVLGTASVQNFLITTGRLSWTIQRSDGQLVQLQTTLFPLHNGTYSYRLDVPHSAIALGLSGGGGVPLPPTPSVHLHASVKVDGQTATLLGPAGSTFTTEQLLRTATYRMDLGLHRTALDTDGDGLPDWWEDLHGLDKQNPTDANTDFTGDGISALQAYLQGLDPHRDNRMPTLLTSEIIVYPAGSTAVLLDTADLDSTPAQLVYTLNRLPPAGTLTLRNVYSNPLEPDLVLGVGDTFTQADLLTGRLIYEHMQPDATPGSFGVEVRDENPAHLADEGDILLLAYQPPMLVPETLSILESRRIDLHSLASQGYVIMDASGLASNQIVSTPSSGKTGTELDAYLAAYGADRSYAIVAPAGTSASAVGGQGNDVLIAGARGTLSGGAGTDVYVFESFHQGRVTLSDFASSGVDIIDMSRLPVGGGGWVHHVLRLIKVNGTYELQTALHGGGYTNLVVVLPGLTDAQADVYSWIESGRLIVGDLHLEPRISVVASQPQASENGPTPGRFTLTRQGRLDTELAVGIGLSGTAQNGIDYVQVPPTVVFPEGVASVDVVITPYQDGVTEPTEFVHLTLQAGSGYRLGTPAQATVSIEDLLMLVEVEVLEPIAVRDAGSPAVILITRRDVINQDVLIRLDIGGSAINGTHYNTLSTFHTMGVNQTTLLLTIMPKPGTALPGGLATVDITVRTSATYRVVGDAKAVVSIIERQDSFAGWRLREFPEATGALSAFAQADLSGSGISHFQRYAFGLDPHQPDQAGLPIATIIDGKLVVSYRQPPGVNDVVYRVLSSRDLIHWSQAALPVVSVPAPAGATDPARMYFRADSTEDTVFVVIEAEWIP
ncbi:MAG TPA: cadherin-like domain-containing protein [Kiritimatiellia bacterium]|nr:cadherin-like domain-containing protein [Kiritimatiellia bacterium]